MWKYILKRLGMMVFVVLGVAIIIFSIMYFVPGNPAQIILGTSATPEQIEELEAQLGLNDPFMVQLGNFLLNALKGDFGSSYITRNPVLSEFMERFPRTLTLAALSILVSVIIGLPLGIIAATHQGKWQDYIAIVISMLGLSIPGFWLALMMVREFSVVHDWLPAYGIGTWKHFVMPVISTALISLAQIARHARTDLLDVIRSDYVTTAKAKGVNSHDVIYKHALPNALIPLVTMIGSSFGAAMGGTVITESVFMMPGVGQYMTKAITNLDYPAVRGSVVILAIIFSFIMLVVDLIYAYIDPRIKAQYAGK